MEVEAREINKWEKKRDRKRVFFSVLGETRHNKNKKCIKEIDKKEKCAWFLIAAVNRE